MQLITAASLRFDHFFVGKDGKILSVGGFRAHHSIMKHMPVAGDGIVWHDGTVDIPQQARMNPGEVAKIGEVLDLTGGIAVQLKGPVKTTFHLSPDSNSGISGKS